LQEPGFGLSGTHLRQAEDDIDFVGKLWMVMSKNLRKNLPQQVVIFLQQGLVHLHGELGHVCQGERRLQLNHALRLAHFEDLLQLLNFVMKSYTMTKKYDPNP